MGQTGKCKNCGERIDARSDGLGVFEWVHTDTDLSPCDAGYWVQCVNAYETVEEAEDEYNRNCDCGWATPKADRGGVAARVRAVKALRMNYRWRGVWVWLRADVSVPGTPFRGRGWKLVLRHPERVIDMQHALAEGAYL